jgi:hypothetical protein
MGSGVRNGQDQLGPTPGPWQRLGTALIFELLAR